MSLLVIGISHKTAPIELREQLAFNKDQLSTALDALNQSFSDTEVAILSTCHRTEFYCSAYIPTELKDWLQEHKEIVTDDLNPHLYEHWGMDAVRHVMGVACGIDSSIIGEPQIFGQMKQAYQTALGVGSVGKLLGRLFQSSFMVAKQVRSDTDIGKSPVSLAFTAVKMAAQIFSNLKETRVLFIGAGETIELCARYFHERHVQSMLFTNRTHIKAEHFAEHYQGQAIPFEEIGEHIHQADIVVTATGGDKRLIDRAMMEAALVKRKRRPVFMIDLAMPRDIDASVTELSEVYLYTVDDLQAIVDDNFRLRVQAVDEAKDMIARHALDYVLWQESLNSVHLIRAYRAQAEQIRDKAVAKAIRALKKGHDAEDVIQDFGRQLTNQLIHDPTVALRSLAGQGEVESVETMKQYLLGFDKKR